jgi:hypothetical protein
LSHVFLTEDNNQRHPVRNSDTKYPVPKAELISEHQYSLSSQSQKGAMQTLKLKEPCLISLSA